MVSLRNGVAVIPDKEVSAVLLPSDPYIHDIYVFSMALGSR